MTEHSKNRPRPQNMREAAKTIVTTLKANGHEALFAGGCVRDMLMGREPSDYDVATSAPPEAVMSLFPKTQKVGAAFGVVLVRIGRFSVEVATFRRDGEYADGRHPMAVQFTNDREDAIRRDFTINGLFYDPITEQVIDYVGGKADIEAGLIRAIGEPARRFEEDHLRLLRAIRFASRLGFQIEPITWKAIVEHAPQIRSISAERIREELEAILESPSRSAGFRQLCDSGLISHLWPGSETALAHREPIAARLSALPERSVFPLAFAVILCSSAPSGIASVCDALRCSNAARIHVEWLCKNVSSLNEPDRLTLADLKILMQDAGFNDLLQMHRAALVAERKSLDSYDAIVARANAVEPGDVAPRPLLTGHDLARLRVPRGPEYSRILNAIYYRQLNGEIRTAEEALAAARLLTGDSASK
ncbi:MAG TPA: CCA tRNA nucleotidyltransferase [Phycisphaerae bacterium]|nr:CCA tRNA nucleotidyltransferase [Phycisphaerae bacterium]